MNPGMYAVTFFFHLYDMIWYSNKEKQREIIIHDYAKIDFWSDFWLIVLDILVLTKIQFLF